MLNWTRTKVNCESEGRTLVSRSQLNRNQTTEVLKAPVVLGLHWKNEAKISCTSNKGPTALVPNQLRIKPNHGESVGSLQMLNWALQMLNWAEMKKSKNDGKQPTALD